MSKKTKYETYGIADLVDNSNEFNTIAVANFKTKEEAENFLNLSGVNEDLDWVLIVYESNIVTVAIRYYINANLVYNK